MTKFDLDPESTCCLFIPLKFGVGLIAMYTLADSLFSIFALLSGDVRFQDTGYDLRFLYITPVVGAFGFIFAWFGVFGVYDGITWQLKTFENYLNVKLLVAILASIADYRTIRACANGSTSTVYTQQYMVNDNPQLYALASLGLCSTAKWAYLFGALLTCSLKGYFCHVVYYYNFNRDMRGARTEIFPGRNNYKSLEQHWKLYEVKDPRSDSVPIHQGMTEKEKRAIAEEHEEEAAQALKQGQNFLVGYAYGATQATPGGEHHDTALAMEEAQHEKNAATSVRLGQLAGAHNVEFDSVI